MKKLDNSYTFKTALKVLPTEGNLVWEYNPFFNYRLDHDMIFYKNRLMEYEEFADEIGLSAPYKSEDFPEDFTEEDKQKYNEQLGIYKTYLEDKNKYFQNLIATKKSWEDLIPKSETPPVPYQKGQLVDFETNELSFDLNNPVNILPQWSYDNSVNLIINDGKNPPRLINSRFSATERNKYQVCNRKGNNDTNIYDQGEQFDIDTSLYKKINTIPELKFLGVSYGGNLSIGNYHFYFKYVDDDGNESDFFAESGLVSIFIGNTADSIYSGFRDENSHKQVKFLLSNTDIGYNKVIIYYTKSTSDIFEKATVNAYRINQHFCISDSENTVITISGFNDVEQVSIEDINIKYQIYGSAETQEQSQNRLFLANVDKPKLDYKNLSDCALRFLPILDVSEKYPINQLNYDYSGSIKNTYYDPNYIYNKVGYWDDEIYRFGVVFIKQDNTLTEVFNVRGAQLDSTVNTGSYTEIELYDKNSNRVYVNYDEQYYNIISNNSNNSDNSNNSLYLENARGVVHIKHSDFNSVIGINFYVKQEVLDYLFNDLKIKGYFFVRQKRIPTTLCQAYTIGIDKESNTPVLPVSDYQISNGKNDNKFQYITEGFLTRNKFKQVINPLTGKGKWVIDEGRILDHDFENRVIGLHKQQVRVQGAICPEYDVNYPYLNTLFSASELVCRNCSTSQRLIKDDVIHFHPEFNFVKSENYSAIKVIGVEDNTKLVAINDNLFSARAGEAEEAFRFEYVGQENKHTDADNLIRGSFGPYLGIVGYENEGHLIDIKIPGYNNALLQDYFGIRYQDISSFYAISDRYSLVKQSKFLETEGDYKKLSKPIYRGDCYICQFTHRMNRNFQDPSAPTNDDIVDPKCWKDHFKVKDEVIQKEKFEKINLGDVNAIQLGMYVTLPVRSSINLNIRSLNDSIPDEEAMFGHPRGFYPYNPMTTKGSYKIPESLCYNKGFEKSVSEKYYIEVPDVPWIKNEFSNRIAYSEIQVQDAFQNGWRTFLGTHYKDYPKTYGSIIKLVEWKGDLLCVFEHGVALIPVNERAIAGNGSGGNVFINTNNVLPDNPKILSDSFGSLWRESIIKTPKGIYGVDTIGKKIWFTDGNQFLCISDFTIQEFLNKNISLTERELEPVIGVRNVKSHYNDFKGDIMFTFYDNLYGFEEKVWNLCYNERIGKWITFYSWVPSYSENINNQYFSFDRNTSKWIAKLGISNSNNQFADGITLDNNIIPNDAKSGSLVGILSLKNRTLPIGDGVTVTIEYELDRDNFGNRENFKIVGNKLYLQTDAVNLCSELFVRTYNTGEKIIELTNPNINKEDWINNCVYNFNGKILKDDRGVRKTLDKENQINGNNLVILLNIKAKITVEYSEEIPTLGEAYAQSFTNSTKVDAGYYKSVVAVIPKYNMQFLTTDFWKHGQAGVIDIADEIVPTNWYGKQHPFEFEFVVADKPQFHKIFDNLQIIGNKAEPESFHYEIIGECYEFANDKKNMYIRQEATKHLYQYNGCDIMYDHNYKDLDEKQNAKSTLFPLYYNRLDSFNEIEDWYHQKDNINSKDFSALAGGEIVHYENLDEYRIWNHAKAIDLTEGGRMRGNMHYKEDKWYVQINPLNLVQNNEDPETWKNGIPIELNQNPIPNEVLENNNYLKRPKELLYNEVVSWNWEDSDISEVKLKDKFIKIRVRYSGKDLAIVMAINTLYSISYA